MSTIEILPNIHWIGVNDRTTDLFEGIWPITQEGVSYNSYLIKDEKNVIIDLAKAFKTDIFFDNIAQNIDLSQVDYVVINHMEPDHTGVLRILKRMSPHLTILCTAKAKKMLADFYGLKENIRIVEDGEELSLGKHTLKFIHTPFVHWPETMMSYEISEQILFSCDGFGGYGAFRGAIFDDQCNDPDFYIKESLRYYVNIVSKFSNSVLKAIDKLQSVPVNIIAPSHGLIWRKNPGKIIQLYREWAGYAKGPTSSGVTILFGSMYGNTEIVMNAMAQGISKEGLPVEIFDVARTHSSYILPSLWTKNSVLIGAPTYEGGLFPPMEHMLSEAALKRVLNKKAAIFGSYGWSGGAEKKIREMIEPLKWEVTGSFIFAGGPSEEDIKKAVEFGRAFARGQAGPAGG